MYQNPSNFNQNSFNIQGNNNIPNKQPLQNNQNLDNQYDEFQKIKKEIRTTWIQFLKGSIVLFIIYALVIFFINLPEQRYKEEYESTTWYEEKAFYDHSYHHRETVDDNTTSYIDYYDWYFKYTGRDGKTYYYIDKDHVEEGEIGFDRVIYVDENDNSHSLPIINYDEDGEVDEFAKQIVFFIVIVPFVIPFLIILTGFIN